MKPAPVRNRYYRVGAQGSDLHYADKSEAFAGADAWERASGVRPKVYRVDVLETWTPVRRPRKKT